MDNREIAIEISGLKKKYKLGQIGGGTLYGDLQSWWARIRGKEDPNSKIGADTRSNGKTFMALNGIDLTVYKGEALGIIGHNGAGKSTLLKLLSRITAPTEGEIGINGRIASMLEVGTGFNPQMTGRENIYMNGAILGMTKAEIDSKIEQIIDFSEVREFIDTPVKRYSSGMYVKLAFSVAAHLDSEIMIMDEVLAVGDMAFQKKCLTKMREVANVEGRTVLYVSHNMNTIRQLCDRCVVLDKGKIIFVGDVEEAISVYLGVNSNVLGSVEVADLPREKWFDSSKLRFQKIYSKEFPTGHISVGTDLIINFDVKCFKDVAEVGFRVFLRTEDSTPIAMCPSFCEINFINGETKSLSMKLKTSSLAPGKYKLSFIATQVDEFGKYNQLDVLHNIYNFQVDTVSNFNLNMQWDTKNWGHVYAEPVKIDIL